jgi:F-type H+-transporting ATPase subunit b
MNATDWATVWATAALVIFLALIAYLKVPGMVNKALDKRSEDIRNQLAEAKRLREEAQALLVEYQDKRKQAEAEAAQIVATAEREADMLAEEAKKKTEDFVARRNALSEQKIKQAETDAINAVRAAAVDLAIAATQSVIASKADTARNDDLFQKALGEVKTRLN